MDLSIPEDLKMIQTLARDFVQDQLLPLEKEILGRDSDLAGGRRNLPAEKLSQLVAFARETGLWGTGVPEEFGGSGLGVLATCLVEEELAKTIIPFSCGNVTPLLFECNTAQRDKYLTPVVAGLRNPGIALIEPDADPDPAVLRMQAKKGENGYLLNGEKLVFSGGQPCDFALVFAVTDPDKNIRAGVTCFLVDNGTAGFSQAIIQSDEGWRAQTVAPVRLIFKDCWIGVDHILGRENQAFALGRQWLTTRRVVHGARCVGAATRLLDKVVEHVKSWNSFNQPVSIWPSVRTALAEMEIDIQAARWLVYRAASLADNRAEFATAAAEVKVFSTEMLKRVADRAVLIKNGPGPVAGLPLEFLCQTLLVQNIGQRALEVQKFTVAEAVLRSGRIL